MGNGISSDKPTRKEKFTPSVNDQQTDLFQRNFMRYNTTEPNIYIIDPKYQSNMHDPANTNDIFSIFNTYNNSNTEGRKTSVTPLSRIFDFLVSPSVSPELISANNFCKTFNSLENNVIEYYRNYHLESAETRCGWTYNTNFNGRIRFEGHLGHNGNPIISLDSEYITHSNTRWFWNLPDAMLLFNSYRCRVTVSNCSNINSNCVWSQGLGYSIPRLQSDIYKPEENAVYRTKELCPTTSVPDTGINPEITSETNVLSGLPFCTDSVKISRDCLNNILTKYKCDTGALKYALNNDGLSGIAADHGIREIPSFMRYNQVHAASNNFFNSASGPDSTLSNALEYFNQLSNYTHSTSNNVINFAARDLCTRRNAYQEFNFCSEYVTGTTKPASGWLMNCIQDTFRRKGGQITGTEYPTANNMSPLWNTFSTWGQIEAYINRLVSDTTSSNIDVEAAAYSKFYGIPTQQFTRQYVSRIPGIEVFWFSIINSSASSPGTIDKFLGRRIQDTLTLQTPTENTNIQFISFFNFINYLPLKYRFGKEINF